MDFFHPAVRRWFESTFPGGPTRAQEEGWPAIRAGEDVLIEAPTGSGKTLAAFLAGLDALLRKAERGELTDRGCEILYVSPLKALNNDVKKNLEEPLRGISACAHEMGIELPELRSAVRTGDTPASERQKMVKRPPHIIITTPESLYLLLTTEHGRRALATVRTVIVDEVHAVLGSKRGAHLALSLERLASLTAGKKLQRVGLSATVTPIEDVARFLVGARPLPRIVAAGRGRPLDLEILVPTKALSAVATLPVWDAVYERTAELVRGHRTTICFLKSRRHVERMGLKMRERLGKAAVATHHGSLSLRTRQRTERRLKRGEVALVVATGSLELGIDVGTVDLVVQVESPGSVATLLQRVGRSGHAVGATSKGRILPLTLDDLVEAVAIVRAVREGRLDRMHVPAGGLDVLAQQLVAECAARGEASERELLELARGAYPYRDLTERDLERVLALHAERPRGSPRGSIPLLHRDAARGVVRPRRAARLVAIGGGGAIPDRANYDVILEPGEKKIGDLDEDFSVESMAGDVFVLGTHSWQITRIRLGKVYVRDAKGKHPTIPFWRGDAPGRTWDLSHDTARLRREVDAGTADLRAWGLDERGERLVRDYVAAGKAVLGVVPDERTLVCERFLDNTGGSQLVLHSPFGIRVNKAWGLALRKRFCKTFDFELQAAATDEGILLSLGPRQALPPLELTDLLPAKKARETLEQAILQAPVFETLFRWNAVRSLAVPRQMGGKRVPPQILRLRAGDYLASTFPEQVACFENRPAVLELPDHPIAHETMREALEDSYDLAHLEEVLGRLDRGEIRVLGAETTAPSPFAHEILAAWGYAFLDDAPLEERRARSVQTHRSLLAGVLATGGLATLLERKLAEEVAAEAARTLEGRQARDAAELAAILGEAGWLGEKELRACAQDPSWLEALRASGEALVGQGESEPCWIAPGFVPVLMAARLGEPGIGGAGSPPGDAAREEVVRRFLGRRPPLFRSEIEAELGFPCAAALASLEASGELLRGRFTRAEEDEHALRGIVERIHRRTLERLRERTRPVSARDLVRFMTRWQGADPGRRRAGPDGLARTIGQLEGWELPAGEWEAAVLPARIEGSTPALLDQLGFSGEVVWGRLGAAVGSTEPLARGPGSVALVLREDLPWLPRGPGEPVDLSEDARASLALLERQGALFVTDLARGAGLSETRALAAVAELVRAGLATGDGFALLRALLDTRGRRIARKRLEIEKSRGTALRLSARMPGRIARLDPPASPGEDEDELAERRAQKLLERWGVLSREVLEHEPLAPRWGELAPALRRLEARGLIRRGLFAQPLSGEQYALPAAVERLRAVSRKKAPEEAAAPIVLAACDPLASFACSLDARAPSVARIAGNRVVLLRGEVVSVREGGELRHLATLVEQDRRAIASAL
jgi:ATP-dependent Lhr-like helicase